MNKEEQQQSETGCAASATCGGDCKSCSGAQETPKPANTIHHKILVMSGKGGVGKSTVAANLAISLALQGRRVGLMDVDIHGPSIPKMLHLEDVEVGANEQGWIQPVELAGVKMMSIGLLLRDRDAAVIWRGPLKMSAIKQFLEEVEWGELDYLIIDAPPGTGDEPLSVCQLAAPLTGAVVVTTPQDVATADVRRSITFCRQLDLPVLGVVENMSGFVCPHCNTVTEIFKSGGGERMAESMGVSFLGRIPLDPAIGVSCDDGKPFVYHYNKTETAKAFDRIMQPILALTDGANVCEPNPAQKNSTESDKIKIAIPTAAGRLCQHFGHCEQFAILEVDAESHAITARQLLTPPPHEPGVLPKWLQEQEVGLVIAGGMGQRAQQLFAEKGIRVVVGAPVESPETLVTQYLAGTLATGENVCDH
ncbi:MAG: P-loop NTPase [Lentisphaerae bacterium]|jgi:Mrp family chromosome partitioning ATPase/predicted Fe-Mo cluster-binding NifX family protein|nr:P-loop NTPase [Lentisphaerota bacterium]